MANDDVDTWAENPFQALGEPTRLSDSDLSFDELTRRDASMKLREASEREKEFFTDFPDLVEDFSPLDDSPSLFNQKNVTPRGIKEPDGGFANWIENPREFQATSFQVCGLYPFVAGVGVPMIGVPLGRHLDSGSIICSDPISWFAKGDLIPNPSLMVTGRPGLGKSTLVRRMALGLAGFGVTPLVFGDLKPDYRNLIYNLGGNVVELGRGRGSLNILDPGSIRTVLPRLSEQRKRILFEDFRGRRLNLLCALLSMNRNGTVTDHEEAILSTALNILDSKPFIPIITDLIDLLNEGSQELRDVTLTSSREDYAQSVQGLHKSLIALASGSLGEVFASQTSTHIDLTKPLCVDISGISESDEKLQSAVLLACWGEGFASIAALQALSDQGVEPQRNFVVILDELWRVLRSGKGMIDRLDALTRLDRASGVGTIMITHTLKDLQGTTEFENTKAKGFAERMGYYAMAGVPHSEISQITDLVSLSKAEIEKITSWSAPESWSHSGQKGEPPGLGNVLLKVGGRPGLPVRVILTEQEKEIYNTNTRWAGK